MSRDYNNFTLYPVFDIFDEFLLLTFRDGFQLLNSRNFNKLHSRNKKQGGNSQNFLRKIRKIFVILRHFYEAVIHRKTVIYEFSSI